MDEFKTNLIPNFIIKMGGGLEQAYLSWSLGKSCQLPVTCPQHVQLLAKLTNLGFAICIFVSYQQV